MQKKSHTIKCYALNTKTQKPKQAFKMFLIFKKKLSYYFRNASTMASPTIARVQ
jgi:hypothetical protein